MKKTWIPFVCCLLAATVVQAGTLFSDSFDRPNNTDIDASTEGMTGLTLTYDEIFEGSGQANSIGIVDNQLRMAVGAGMSDLYLDYNLTTTKQFSISLDIIEINSVTSDIVNRFGGFGLGMSLEEAQALGDINNDAVTMAHNDADTQGAADFFYSLALDGILRVWQNGTVIATYDTGGEVAGTLKAEFEASSFDAGATVTYTVYFNGEAIQALNGSFMWDYAQTNYVGLSSRASSYVALDNLLIEINTSASAPSPAAGATDVPWDSVLSWSNGMYAATHNFYIGTSYEEVDTATVPTASGLDVNSFDPGRLGFDQTYYWRVDEVNGAPDYTVYKGDIWSFTAEPYSILVSGDTINATASTQANELSPASKTIDGSGLGEDGSHSLGAEDMWFSVIGDETPWIQYEFDEALKLDIIKIWNSNTGAEPGLGWGVKDVQVEYSEDGVTWVSLNESIELTQASGTAAYKAYDTIQLNGVKAKAVRLIIESNFGGYIKSYSLSEVQFYMIPAKARTPVPESETTDVLPNSTLKWRSGREAVTHTLYIDTDSNAVAEGTATSVTSNTNSLELSTLDLQLGQTYYWRVDEVNLAEDTPVWTGPIWQFSTPEALVVDDFESYNNLSPDRPFQAWLDGVGYSEDAYFPNGYNGNGTGSGIGYDIWGLTSPYLDGYIMETATVVSGSQQSMPLYYTNTSGVASEIELSLDTPQDWTLYGIKALSIWVYGQNTNTGQLYAKINSSKVVFNGPINRANWQLFTIDLSTLAVTNVTSLMIGVDGANAEGMVLLDDILLDSQIRTFNPGLTTSEDEVLGVPNDGLTTGGDYGWPEAEAPEMLIDNNVNTKLLHFKGELEPTGIQITPKVGATVVTEIKFTTANDADGRDPVAFELYGSNAGIEGPYTLIASGDMVDFMQEEAWPRLTENETPITFENNVAYTHYQILLTALRNPAAVGMQLSEIELFGTMTE